MDTCNFTRIRSVSTSQSSPWPAKDITVCDHTGMLPRFHCQDLGLNGTLDDAQRVALTFLNLWDLQFCMNRTRFPRRTSMSGKKLHQQIQSFLFQNQGHFLVLDSLLPHPGGPFLGFASEKTLAGQDLSFRSDSALYGIFPWRWRHSRSCSDADAPNASKCYEIQEVCKPVSTWFDF